ncbi:MAG: hypothetical protein KKD35_01220, partial [Elusimicrobia bacterium]|nr:hypothetical protein [Elusimicrobiota bacterium]
PPQAGQAYGSAALPSRDIPPMAGWRGYHRGYAYHAAKRGGNMNMKHIWGDPTTSSVPPMAGLKKRPIKDWEEVVG